MKQNYLRDLLSFYFISQSLLVPSKSFLLNRAVRSRPVKEMRWLTGITGYTLMEMLRQSWLAVKVRPFSLLIKKKFNLLAPEKNIIKICKTLEWLSRLIDQPINFEGKQSFCFRRHRYKLKCPKNSRGEC